jgi:hypothetical protein
MTHALVGGLFPEDEDLASAWCDQGCETEAPTVSKAISLLTCVSGTTNEEAPASGRTPDRGTTENPELEPINMAIEADTADIRIVDNDSTQPGTYLTAWTRSGTDWQVTVDYFEHQGRWTTGGYIKDDETGRLEAERVVAFLDAHSGAESIAAYLNDNPLTQRLRDIAQQRADHADLIAALTADTKGN